MHIIALIIYTSLGLGIGSLFGHYIVGTIIGIVMGILVTQQSNPALHPILAKRVREQTDGFLTEIWAALPALKRIEAYDAEYLQDNLQDIFSAHFRDQLGEKIHTSDEIIDLARMIIATGIKPAKQIAAFRRRNSPGLRGIFKNHKEAHHCSFHLGRVYARAGATPAMLQWADAWAQDMGIKATQIYCGYTSEIEKQDDIELTRLIDGQLPIDDQLDEISNNPGTESYKNVEASVAHDTLYAEYRKAVGRLAHRRAA